MGGSGPFGESSGGPVPIAVENFQMLKQRQRSDTFIDAGDGRERVNLLNWDGKGKGGGLYAPPADEAPPPGPAKIRTGLHGTGQVDGTQLDGTQVNSTQLDGGRSGGDAP